jgi:hypothetical protein
MLNQVFVSYRHESVEHARAVRRLCESLRQSNIPVVLDQFFLEQHPGGPDSGWPKWCEDSANHSRCVLIVASEGWFAAYEQTASHGEGLGAATEADIIRQTLYDEKGNNSRIRLTFLHHIAAEKVPVRLRAWHQFRPFDADEQLDQLIRWITQSLGLSGIVPRAPVRWPSPVAFEPDLANRDQEEWPAVVDLLAGRTRRRILLFEGESGLGKSELVRQATRYGRQIGLPSALVNFKGGVLRIEDVLGEIDLELGMRLPNFSREGASRTHLLRKDLRALCEPVFLVFDSYEDVAENKAVADWISLQLLAEVETALGLGVIIAGQRVPEFASADWCDLVHHIRLAPITEIGPWQEWVSRRYPGFQDKGHLPTILKLAGGRPSVMANYCAAIAKG